MLEAPFLTPPLLLLRMEDEAVPNNRVERFTFLLEIHIYSVV
jgi:hypothetical protein